MPTGRGNEYARADQIGAIAGLAGLFLYGWMRRKEKPPPGAPLGQRVYYRYCAACHGRDGRGSWRAVLFLLRPGDLTDGTRMLGHSDQYLFDLVKHGGAPLGKPGMPGFGFNLTDEQIRAVVAYVRSLSQRRGERAPLLPDTPHRFRTVTSSRGNRAARLCRP